MTVLGMPIEQLIAGVLGVGMAVAFAYKWGKELVAQKKGLAPNPKRCHEHELRIWELEKACVDIRGELRGLRDIVGRIEKNTDALLELHLQR